MRILNVSPRALLPATNGHSIRAVELLRPLAENGHEVRLFSNPRRPAPLRGPAPKAVREESPLVEHRHLNRLAALVNEVGERSWLAGPVLSGAGLRLTRPALLDELLDWAEVTIVDFPWQFAYLARRRPQARLVLNSHNFEAAKYETFAELSSAGPLRRPGLAYVAFLEGAAVRRADLVLAVSPVERDAVIARYGADPDHVIEAPNGANTRKLAPVGAAERAEARRALGLPDRTTVLYPASWTPPHREGADWVRRIARLRPDWTFVIAGTVGGEQPSRDGNVVVTGFVRDILPWFRAADLGVCPVSRGGGTKLKVFEFLAAGLPAVAFPESVRGAALEHGVHLLMAKHSEASLVAALDLLLADPAYAQSLAAAGRERVVERYDWRVVSERVEQALEAMAA